MATQAPPPNSAFLGIRYWPTWIGIGLLSIIAWLPFRLRMGIGALLGKATMLLARERRYITEINIRLCFPELSAREQAALLTETFVNNGIGLIETATGWIRPPEHFRHLTILKGEAELAAALAQGKGLLLMGAHYSTLDFGANLLSLHFPFAVTYRAHKNPLFDAFMLRGRIRNCNGVFDRKDIRGAFRHLKGGKILWYAPDQDYGPDQAVYASFFGHPAATITAGSRFAAFNKSPVFMVGQRRLVHEQRYVLEFTPLPDNFPSGNDEADATLINRMLETEIRKAPAQYLWMHKRFKTQPEGKPGSPYINISTPNRKLTVRQYQELTKDARTLEGKEARLQLVSGLQLWNYRGLANGLGAYRHPALRLDRTSKFLRSHGITTVTVDSIYRISHNNTTAVLVYIPDGNPIGPNTNIDPRHSASFLFSIHGNGCSFMQANADNLLWNEHTMALLDPLALRIFPGTAAYAYRLDDLKTFSLLLNYSSQQAAAFNSAYLAQCRSPDRRALEELMMGFPGDH